MRKCSIFCPWCGSPMRTEKGHTYTVDVFPEGTLDCQKGNSMKDHVLCQVNGVNPVRPVGKELVHQAYRTCKNEDCGYRDYARWTEDKVWVKRVIRDPKGKIFDITGSEQWDKDTMELAKEIYNYFSTLGE